MKRDRGVFQAFSMIGQFGINMIVPIFLCSFVGHLLDRRLNTSYLVIVLFFIGAVAGGYNVFRMARGIYSQGSSLSAYGVREDDGPEQGTGRLPENSVRSAKDGEGGDASI